jgi:hypothetical protein
MLESPAMRGASLSARRVIDRIEIELGHHGGTENGKLPVTYADFVHFGIDRHAIAPAIREAIALGFVEVTKQGRAGNAEYRSPSLYRLTFRHTDRENPTHEWRRIETIEQAHSIANAARSMAAQKQKTSGGKRHVSVRETHTETATCPVGKTRTTVPVGKTPTTFISGWGARASCIPGQAGRAGRARGA